MSLGLVPTQISCHFFSLRGFLRQVFSGRRSNHDVCKWLLSSRYVLLSRAVTAISENTTVLYTCFFIIVRWCSAETCKINLMVQYIGCLLCSVAEMSNAPPGGPHLGQIPHCTELNASQMPGDIPGGGGDGRFWN